MSWFYRRLIRPVLFAQDSEQIHNRTIAALGSISRSPALCSLLATVYSPAEIPVEVFGLRFPNPVGLAAGMDKHAAAVPAWKALGFGFTELGGVTWHPQLGNPAPRMFRAVAEEALINRMGFNNPGAEAMAETLRQWREHGRWPKHPIGINLGKSKITPNENAAEDYANSFRRLLPFADFFVVNVSSPNTPNLRQLQEKAALDEILAAMQEVNSVSSSEFRVPGSPTPQRAHNPEPETRNSKPLLVKVAPDLSFDALDEILELAAKRNLAGIVATNTTITRPQPGDERLRRIYSESGGLSGRPLRARSREVIRHIHQQTRGRLPIIGVGGIFSADDAWEKITAVASLVQIYTGLVYEGPALAKHIVCGLAKRLEQSGFKSLQEAVGAE
jgi:dihydroorotate dehydrogenase